MKKKRETVILENITIDSMAAEGKCVAKVDGMVIFTKNTAPGDVVDILITKKKKSFAEGYPVKYHTYSDTRVTPECSHFGVCGGCKWQHVDYKVQLAYKQQQVVDSLERIGKVDIKELRPILGNAEPFYYRNKLEFTFSNRRWLTTEEIATDEKIVRHGLGFHIPGRFDKVLDIDKCLLQGGLSNDIRNWFRTYANEHGLEYYDLIHHQGFLRSLMIRTTSTNETMVVLQVREDDQPVISAMLNALKSSFPSINSINYVVNGKKNDTLFELEIINFSGSEHITERMGDLQFLISPKSFYQTNSDQAFELYKIVDEMADLKGTELVFDLYTGTGTIANFLAHKAKKVIGIEYVDDAVADAKKNMALNGIDNVQFYVGDMKDLLTNDLTNEHGMPDVVITDPPRAGMHPDVVAALINMAPSKIVYVSCNPATQARDLEQLSESYEVAVVQPVDMFPHTHHVENVVLLIKK
jgi:23S rRNA (uracil1939-C5)-methyltransferase